jgi:hypothetical protein
VALDNVVPIDADAARLLERRNTRFRWFVAGLSALWIGILVPVLLFTPLPPVGPFALLAVLVVLAEHRFVLFGDETSMSASIVVVVASVFVFADSSPLAGPMLIASVGGLYFPHLVHGRCALTAANASSFGVAAAIAGALSQGLLTSQPTEQWCALVAAVICVASYWYVNSVLIGCASALRNESELRTAVRDQVASEWAVLFLALGAALLAQTVDANSLALLPAILIPLAAFEIEVRGFQRIARHWSSRSPSLRAAAMVGLTTAFLVQTGGDAGLAPLALGVFFGVNFSRAAARNLDGFALAMTASVCVFVALDGAGLPVASVFLLSTFLALSVVTLREIRMRPTPPRQRVGLLVGAGLMIPARREVAGLSAIALVTCGTFVAATTTMQQLVLFTALAAGIQLAPTTLTRGRVSLSTMPPTTDQRSTQSVSR